MRFGFITAVSSVLKMEASIRLDWCNGNALDLYLGDAVFEFGCYE
jgi:hypothetical protein